MENVTVKIKDFFVELKFDMNQHRYSVGNLDLPSVSKLLGGFQYPFETEKIAEQSAIKYNKTKEELIQEWEDTKNEACDRGHRVHDFAER